MPDPTTNRLKALIVTTRKLHDIAPEEIPDDEPLIGSPRLGLDSIDALELVLAVEKEFGVKIGSSEESRRALGSVNALAAYLRANNKGA
jgi:acyl carrier protein